MQDVLEFHKKNLQQRGHVNEAWEKAFRSDSELRDTKQTLSRIVHGLPTASVKDNIASVAPQDDYHDKPVQDLLGGTELEDLSLGASEVKEDSLLLEELASHVDNVHINDPSGEAEDRIPHDMLSSEAYGILGEDAQVSRHHEENARHPTTPSREQLFQLKGQSVGAGNPPPPMPSPSFDRRSDGRRRPQIQTSLRSQSPQPDFIAEPLSFRRFETPPPLTEEDDFKLGSRWWGDAYGVRAVNGGRQESYSVAPRRRVYEDQRWPEPLPASAFALRPREVSVETPEGSKTQESDEERVVIRTLKKRLSSFLDGTKT